MIRQMIIQIVLTYELLVAEIESYDVRQQPKLEEDEWLGISTTNAVAYPNAVVIHVQDTNATAFAVVHIDVRFFVCYLDTLAE